MSQELIEDIRARIKAIRADLGVGEIATAEVRIPGCKAEVSRLRTLLRSIEAELDNVPPIKIAFLGPSRHGKSTLLNALAAQQLLPMSDTKPCTASILRLKWAQEWSVTVKFVSKDELVSDWQTAVKDAVDYVRRMKVSESTDEAPDDPKYILNTLQRFIQLFRLNREDDPLSLIEQVRNATIPSEIAKNLGKFTRPITNSFHNMKGVVAKFLSTQDVYWTVVESCEIEGPFDNWHTKLSLIDLPGTNDSNPHRTAITNQMREEAQAVAIVTSDSNIGPDIESWLRNSSVLSEFLESRSSNRQRLFVIRTKLDSFHPQIDSAIEVNDEAEEERLYQEAFHRYKQDQSATYREMFREIVLPRLPSATGNEVLARKRQELLDRVAEIPVHFVSAYAHEAFEGRATGITPRNLKRLKEHFSGDANATGIPRLRAYINQIAAEYLTTNYYGDINLRLESEVGLLARYFQKESSAVQAKLAGAGESVHALVTTVKNDVVPWIAEEVRNRTAGFQSHASVGGNEVRQRLDYALRASEQRLRDKQEKWSLYPWNSLRATARKQGQHTTVRGDHIDINEDVCSVLIGDVMLAWTSYRDYLVQKYISDLTNDFSLELQQRLNDAASRTDNPHAKHAIEEILNQLQSITFSQRDELLRQIEKKVQQLESIREPAKAFVARALSPVFSKIENERGAGCQQRMRQLLLNGFQAAINPIRDHIANLVQQATTDLLDSCSSAMHSFGQVACARITHSVHSVAESVRSADEEYLKEKSCVLDEAVVALKKGKYQSQREYWAWHDSLYLGGSSKSPEWQERSREAKTRDGWKCILCGTDDDELHADHIIPLSKGGTNEMSNLQTLCVTCHETKTGRPLRRPVGIS